MGLSSFLIYVGGTEIGFKFIASEEIVSVIKLESGGESRGCLEETLEVGRRSS
jgi:hypothetical protein